MIIHQELPHPGVVERTHDARHTAGLRSVDDVGDQKLSVTGLRRAHQAGSHKWWLLIKLLLPTSDVFYVEGRYLYDNDRRKVILRAINLPLLDDWNFPGSDKPLLLMT